MIAPERVRAVAAPLLDRCRFPTPGTAVTCGVSGGADSLSLLVLALAAGCRATAVHVDHGLRPGSEAEADHVQAVAESLGAGFRAVQVSVTPGPNLEARARTARHRALPPGTLLGHTAEDQAETVVLNLLRGAGPDGLAGIRADERHPILALRRHETEALCRELGLVPLEDPSNRDRSFRRNRVRLEVLPLLSEIAERDVVAVLARQAGVLREVSDHLAAEAAAIEPTDAAAVAAASPVLARVALRRWLRRCSDEGHPPDAAAIDRVLSVARGAIRATEVGGGWRVARRAGRLRVEPPPGATGASGRVE